MTTLRVTDDTTAADLAEALAHLNAAAKAISRRGKSAMLRPEYAAAHARIDALVTDWEAARG